MSNSRRAPPFLRCCLSSPVATVDCSEAESSELMSPLPTLRWPPDRDKPWLFLQAVGEQSDFRPMADALRIAGGLVALIVGAHVLVGAGAGLAAWLGIRPIMVGLTVVALGTSVPELAVGID